MNEAHHNTQQAVEIVDYEARYAEAFRDINKEWIEQFFVMEESDYQALDKPEIYILDKGGYIFVALVDNEPIGVVAMIKHADQEGFELAKMGVRPQAQGRGVGRLLGEAVKDKARQLGVKRLYLESNRRLQPALKLYHRLGFQELTDKAPSPYARCDIQMELWL